MAEHPTLCGMLELAVPYAPGGMGMLIDGARNMIIEVTPGGLAAQCGLAAGDVVAAIDEHVVTQFDWAPGTVEGTLFASNLEATATASAALDPSRPQHTFKVLRALAPAAPEAGAAAAQARAEGEQQEEARRKQQLQQQTAEQQQRQQQLEQQHGAALRLAAEAREAEEARRAEEAAAAREGAHMAQVLGMSQDEQEARGPPGLTAQQLADHHYPWATEFQTAEGSIKVKYNLGHGQVLAPVPKVQATHETTARKNAFATLRKG